MTQSIKATVAEHAQETNYVTLDAEATAQDLAWRMKLIAPPIQWNLDTADRALVNNNYRRTSQWSYSRADQTWSAAVEKIGRRASVPRHDSPILDRPAPGTVLGRGETAPSAPSQAVQGHPRSLSQMLAGSATRGAVDRGSRPAEQERGPDRGSSLDP
ncbi:hypothetical protein [Rhodococcus triatomae]